MKNRIIFAAAFILLGLLVILAPTVLFPVCESEMKMACFFTKKAEIGAGLVIAALGVIYFFLKNKDIRLGISIAQFLNAGLVLAFPAKLTGLCKMSDMACRVKTYPALIVLSVLLALTAAVNIVFLIKSESEK
ncbi:MAG: DUF4418 family protein [Clostridiales bacterium]|jgi:hypothetical protein|nr:DUF4418 family protein [Clostridiales bacterium]